MKIYSNIIKSLAVMFLVFSTQAFADAPNQVTNVQTVTEGETIKLTWDEAESDDDIVVGYRIYYGTNSVQVPEDIYTENPIDTGAETEYIFENLEKNIRYYFAITALDSIDRESNNYSLETSASLETETATEESVIITEEEITEIPEEEVIDQSEEEEIITEEPEAPVEEIEASVEEEEEEEIFQPSAPDTTAPKSANNLFTKSNSRTTTVSWTRSLDSDVSFQQLASKEANDLNWKYKNIDKFVESAEIDTEADKNYMVKIITTDAAGNKSESATKTFSTTLAKAGSTSNLAIIIAIAFMGLLLFSVKRKA